MFNVQNPDVGNEAKLSGVRLADDGERTYKPPWRPP